MRKISVSKLPVDPGPSGWVHVLDAPSPARVIDARETADWLITGAGFAGLAAARRLSQLCPTDRIVVLDAKRVAEGPAGRNSGFMIDLPHDLASEDYGGAVEHDVLQTADNRHAIAFAAEMATEFGLPEDVFSQCGKINGAATENGDRHNREYAQHLEDMGEASEMLDAGQMREITGTTYYRGGLFTAGTAVIQPAAFVRGVARGLSSNRVQVFENSPVTELSRNGVWTAKTPKGSVEAPKVILAVNGHLNSFGFMKSRLMHVFTYASMTRPLTADEARSLGGREVWGLTPADPMGSTVRRIQARDGARIVVRNRFTFDPSMEVSDRRVANVGRDHDRAFAARFPALAGIEMQYRWGGRLCLSRNNVNVVAELDDGLYSACCQNGLGTVRGTFGGMMAAEMAADVTSERLDRVLSAPKPVRLPPEPIARVGANAVIKWQERKAGAEL